MTMQIDIPANVNDVIASHVDKCHGRRKLEQELELRIAYLVVREALAANCLVSVFDGEEYPLKRSSDAVEIMRALCSTDEDTLLLRDANGARLGSVLLIWGNGQDVISDYSYTPATCANVELILAKANEYAESYR